MIHHNNGPLVLNDDLHWTPDQFAAAWDEFQKEAK